MKLTIQDVDDALSLFITLATDSIKNKKLLYCPLTARYILLVNKAHVWAEGKKSKHESIVAYNQI